MYKLGSRKIPPLEETTILLNTLPPYNPETRQHFWIVIGVWEWNSVTSKYFELSPSTMISVFSPGCGYCEAIFEKELEGTECPGKVNEKLL